jgi:aminoglycoside phosphotransferase (APT) family kinase protein
VPEVTSRDLDTARGPIAAWLLDQLGRQAPAITELVVDLASHTTGGYSNEIIMVDASYRRGGAAEVRHLVLRLPPPGPALFPTYDLAMQVAVQEAVGDHGVPVPSPITFEPDERWLGAPFLVMPRVSGHDPGELPVVDPWVAGASTSEQRALHQGFLDTVARIHATPWRDRPVAGHLRGASGSLDDEVGWWAALAEWCCEGDPPALLTGAFQWCRDHRPTTEPPPGLLWGDVRLGNVIFDDRFAPAAVLDWEMASIGPAELDLAWYTALEAMTEHFFGQRVPGFLTRDEIVAAHQQALGRPLVDLEWFEIFAMCRSAVLNIRADRLGALRRGRRPRAAEDNAVLAYAVTAIDARR